MNLNGEYETSSRIHPGAMIRSVRLSDQRSRLRRPVRYTTFRDIIRPFNGIKAPVYGSAGPKFHVHEEKGAGSRDPPLFLCGIF